MKFSRPSKRSPATKCKSLARDFFQPDRIAVTVLGPLNGFSVDRARLGLLSASLRGYWYRLI